MGNDKKIQITVSVDREHYGGFSKALRLLEEVYADIAEAKKEAQELRERIKELEEKEHERGTY